MPNAADMRGWLKEVDRLGELERVDGADWKHEIGCIAELNNGPEAPALLFDNIKDYPKGYRLVCSSLKTPSRIAHTLNLPASHSYRELLEHLQQAFPQWREREKDFPPEQVSAGPVMENTQVGKEVDLLKFPTPKWHEHDGGRYIGTGHAFVTRDPDTGEINLGTYRMMLHDRKTTGIYIAPAHHGGIHAAKYHQRGQPCPVVISLGHHPLILGVSDTSIPGPEYNYAGAIRGKPIKVIKEEVTGLPMPADSEIVLAGWYPPNKTRMEGPFGEWTGYYASKQRLAPIIEIERVYHRTDPIMLGSVTCRPPDDEACYRAAVRSAMIYDELKNKAGIPGVKAVWMHEATGGNPLLIVSIKQHYAGHARQAASLAANSRIVGLMNRYVIVVDDDIDPTNTMDVIWALGSRTNPAESIDIMRRVWSSPLDPTLRRPAPVLVTSRAVIDACKPFEWIDEFPMTASCSPELAQKTKRKWGKVLRLK